MQTLAQLIEIGRALRQRRVLSVYLDGTTTNPAQHCVWRTQLDQSITDLRTRARDSSHADRKELDACVRQVEDELGRFRAGIGAVGWVAFVTADGVHLAESVSVPMPTKAIWGTGASITPYVRALKESRRVVLAIADSRHATLYLYHDGELHRIATFHAHHEVSEPAHMSTPPRRGFHGGTRGVSGHDAAQRGRLEGRLRMLERATHRILGLAGADGWILVGGVPETARALAGHVARHTPRRVECLGGVDVHASQAKLVHATRTAAARLRQEADRAEIAGIANQDAATGKAALGPADTRRTLDEARVRTLYFTNRYLREHALDAEEAVRAAIAQGAEVEEVSGTGAALLDRHGGMAARLRYHRP